VIKLKAPVDLRRAVQRPEWLWGFAAAAGALLLAYGVGATLVSAEAGNAWGVVYGSLAAALLAAVALLGVRRRTMRLGLGRAQDWAQFHVYGGTLFMLLVLMHTGFRWPRAALTW